MVKKKINHLLINHTFSITGWHNPMMLAPIALRLHFSMNLPFKSHIPSPKYLK